MKKAFPHITFFCFGLILFNTCAGKQEDPKFETKTKQPDSITFESIAEDLKEEQIAQTHIIEKKAVVFFMISKNEMKNVMHEIGDSYRWETEALFNNFIKQAGTFQTLLKKHNIKCELSHNNQFEIKLKGGKIITFNRIEKDQILGEIISDGIQEPLIEFGMFTNDELAKKIEAFYKIENLGYIPPPDTTKAAIQEEPQEELP